jgi:catechol 2,3-dioxygenase-like lactoylglutathione lyase family enzyme
MIVGANRGTTCGMRRSALSALVMFLFTSGAAGQTMPSVPAAGRITGVGGIFVTSKDPKALAAWYREVLGIDVASWGGATLRYDAPGHPPVLVWSAFPRDGDYLAPSSRELMINFAVDDLDAFVARLKTHGVTILKRDDTDANGKFAWILDPDGTKIELWEPHPD